MADIQVTTNQSVIEVTQNNGITVTTPEGQTIAVTVPNSSVEVTTTTDNITVLTNGTLVVEVTNTDRLVAGTNQVILNTNATMSFPNNAIDFGNQPADLKSSSYSELWYRNANPTPTAGQGIQTYVWSWENQAGIAVESVDNGYKEWYFNANGTTQFPGYTFPYADGSANQVLKTNGSGTLAWYSPSDANTTYTIDATTASGGANFNLVGSDSSTDTIKIASGTNITVSRTDANTITIDGSDLNTTYAISSASTTGGANLTLTGSDASTDSVAYLGSGATTVTSTDANTITIASTDTNTTYTQNASATSGGANLNLVGSDSTTDSIKLASGTNVTVTRTDADTVTFSSTDTNTTYTQNFSATSGGTNLNLVGSDSTTDTVKFANGTGVTVTRTDADTATIAIGQSVGTGDSPSFAGVTGGNITVGVATDQTITTTSGDLILDSNSGTISLNVPTITTDATTLALFNTTATTVNAFGAATTTNIGKNTGSSIINGVNRFTSPTIYGFTGGASTPSRGYMQSNGNTGSFASARNNIVMRTFPNIAATTARGGLIFENARGNETTPTAIVSGDFIGELSALGYATNGYTSDYILATPGTAYFTATETWANTGGPYPTAGTVTNAGTGYILALQPTATNLAAANAGRVNVLNINPQTFNSRSDAFTWSQGKSGSNQMMTLGSTGNLTINNATTGTTYFQTYKDSSNHVTASINQTRATSGNEFASAGWNTYRSTDGINYTPTLNGDVIGEFKFNGNANTSTSPGVPGSPGGNVVVAATENWTALANGTKMQFLAIKKGSLESIGVFTADPISSSFTSDSFTFKTAALSPASPVTLATVDSTSATFTVPVGFPVKTAAQWNAITGAVGQQVCVSNSAGGGNPNGMMAFWDTTHSRWSYIHDNTAV
jgi:hypothetical protein